MVFDIRIVFAAFMTFLSSPQVFAFGLECESWFQSAHINPGLGCVFECTITKTDKNSGSCPLFCADLCDAEYFGVAFFKLSDIYPGLTLAERGLVAEFPRELTKAYAASWKAEQTCIGIYKASATNDESDACRHYVWAGLLAGKLGSQLAQKVLDAHENNPQEPLEEKSMDLANNRGGILACERLSLTKQCDSEHLLKSFINDLESGRLIVLKPKSRRNP